MEIKWYGHSCFKVKGKNTSIVFDPYSPGSTGYDMGNISADIVAISHNGTAHNYEAGVGGKRKVLNGPGEYEIGDAIIIGVLSARDITDGQTRGKNTIYCVELDELNICHLGDVGHNLSDEQLGEIGQVNVLMLPIGGSLGVKGAVALINKLQPQIVLPMCYGTEKNDFKYTPVKDFLKEFGAEDLLPQPVFKLNKNSIPLTMQICLLEA
ncbi:MAG: MBL fold metallo-hydrolase [Chloroflexi bacterium]|nr:MBL fold metallo-hydrolase [Chloroflexota bacterium]